MAKTAGSEINGAMASYYRSVCGNKGYSYDAYQYYKRLQQKGRYEDIVREAYPEKRYTRGYLPHEVLEEIGYEECDYISLEAHWEQWKTVVEAISIASFSSKNGHNNNNPQATELELHVPCRDPLSHLMSQCNHRQYVFDCETKDLKGEVEKCLIKMDRFDPDGLSNGIGGDKTNDNNTNTVTTTLKCFNPIPIEPYLEYMEPRLEPRRVQAPFYHRSSNSPRNKTQECLWKNPVLMEQVLEILHKTQDYYRWCQECIGSNDDLLAKSR